MEKIVEQGLLYDFYGSLLTDRQRSIYEKVVYDNLSLGEISEAEGISRQAVHDLVRRSTDTMREYEEKLGMIERFRKLRTDVDRLIECTKEDADDGQLRADICAIAQEIRQDVG